MPRVHPDLLHSGDAAAIQAAEALVKALTTANWGTKKFPPVNFPVTALVRSTIQIIDHNLTH